MLPPVTSSAIGPMFCFFFSSFLFIFRTLVQFVEKTLRQFHRFD